ncbi:HAD family hydrolase [Actinokineospora sp. PR83]|uniref:HAD family hydrolase n=1 Tax=Actinokineospora sp. PR83 TaxID=2884908 RepID=UPI001F4001AF|nr:HAD family hydrolase [Actinokineospora sp. PR83]MCG8920796.1 HAD family hydrolase [Actinokineospora sp. PR83]
MPDTPERATAVLDVDGTLVDTNYQHALAWYRAFRGVGRTLPVWRLHRHIGMGGDRLVPAVAGEDFERAFGDEVREAWVGEFDALIDEVRPFEGVDRLLGGLRERGFEVVLATSGKPEHVDVFRDLLDARDLPYTTSEDVGDTKPAPDLMQVALDKVGATEAVALGDSVWDFHAARKLGLRTVGLLTGGFGEAELRDAGAEAVFPSVLDLADNLDVSPFSRTGPDPSTPRP